MSDDPPIKLATRGLTTTETATEMANRVKELMYEYDGVSLAVALGSLEIAKYELMEEHIRS